MASMQKQWFKGKTRTARAERSVAISDLDPRLVRRAIVVGVTGLVVLIVLTVGLILWGPGSRDQLFFKLLLLVMGAAFAGIGGFAATIVAPAVGSTADLMAATPTTTATNVLSGGATGVVELKGTAADGGDHQAEPALVAPLSNTPCLHFGVSVVQVTEERDRGSDGSATFHERRTTVATEASDRPFWLQDATGRVRISPAGADVTGRVTVERQEEPRANDRVEGLLAGEFQVRGVRIDLPWRSGDGERVLGYEITEQVIAPGDPLYALGPIGTHDGAPAVMATSTGERFVVRVGTEEEAIASVRSDERLFRLVGALFAGIGVVLIVVGLALAVAL
ncbi:MAG: hypothetical protein QOF01_31 [Thermomicrobiales bacterium]|jgi:hypothetical protein|nr:hypothetical protein [Thermomicrobiales bacterium]